MTSTLLDARQSRANSPRRSIGTLTPEAAYEYEDVADLEGEPTKAAKSSSPIGTQNWFDSSTTQDHEDPDLAYSETLPHIWQRHQGGWNARIPDLGGEVIPTVDISPGGGSGVDHAPTSPNIQTSRQAHKRGLTRSFPTESKLSLHMHITLHWDLERSQRNRKLQLRESASNERDSNIELQKRVIWRHYDHKSISLDYLEDIVNECKNRELSDTDTRLIHRLVNRLRVGAERTFAGGNYLIPLALRYDDQDVSRYTVDKTCIFFSFPYFQVADTSFRLHLDKEDNGHPPRTILQSHYRLNKTVERDRFQCIRLLEDRTLESCIEVEPQKVGKVLDRKKKYLVYVPQFWGLIVGLDTMITAGSLDKPVLWGPAVEQAESDAWPAPGRLSFIRSFFYYHDRLEDLIFPLSQCNFWFGLLNKQQQILGFLADGKEKPASVNYQFWIGDKGWISEHEGANGHKLPFVNEKAIIDSDHWLKVLHESQSMQIMDVWLKEKVPAISVSKVSDGPTIGSATLRPVQSRTSSQSHDSARFNLEDILEPFLVWPILDESGERDDKLDINDRVSRFLRAIYLELPIEKRFTNEELSKKPGQAVAQHAGARPLVTIRNRTLAQVEENFDHPGAPTLALQFLDQFRRLLRLFLPQPFSDRDSLSPFVQLYWGATYQLLQVVVAEDPVPPVLHDVSKALDKIIAHAWYLHQGVQCYEYKLAPNNRHHPKMTIGKGAVLLSAIVDAFGTILHMLVEVVEYLRISNENHQYMPLQPHSKIFEYANEALKLLKTARNQLIRGADGRNSNDIIGPVLTPEAIVITLMERLVSGVFANGTVDIIRLYEECLERLALEVKYEASRRLLQKINEFQEEVLIVNDVLKQQVNVLLGLRASLDPLSFRTPSITRKLRYVYECAGIDRLLTIIREQLRSCKELRDRAGNLTTQNVQLVETLQDDNSKAIFIFTMVTVLFLPLTFVAGFFGMNFGSINNTEYTVWHFWEIGLPLTFGVIILCAVVALKGEDVYFIFARLGRKVKMLFRRR